MFEVWANAVEALARAMASTAADTTTTTTGASDFAWALGGGLIIGVAVSLYLWTTGRVLGISGIVSGLLSPVRGDFGWRVVFVMALVASGAVAALLTPSLVTFDIERNTPLMVVAGLLVGIGTRLGNGCTSGHGVCGISRLSKRSLVATVTFMLTGVVAATAVRLLVEVQP